MITWFCLVCLSLHITNTRTGHPVNRFYRVPGGNIQIRCFFPSSGQWRIFCRENCEKEKILIETNKISSQAGRYRIESDRNNQYFTVSISALTRSDSGWYRCGQRSSSSRYSYRYFDLVVAEALLDGNEVLHLHKEPGSSLTVACSFSSYEKTKYFCRGGCEEVVLQTDAVRADRGRYSIEYEGGVLYVSISALTRSDSGWYRCNLDLERWPDEYRDFYLTVTDAVKPTTSRKTATTRSFSSSASSFTASGSSAATDRSALGDGHQSPPDVLLIVGLALAFIIVMLTLALLVFCRNRSQKHDKDPAEKRKKTPAAETNRDYAEIRGDEMKSVPVEICTVYSYASYSKPAATAADGVCSLATAALPLDEAEDDLTRPTYAQVNFLNRSSDCPQRPDDVVYSVPRVAVGSHVGEESLYSNTA
ncbi:PREDICTED: uncharacterized protein LOC106906581 [Poecilia mexicana]|uniref:uncharacterized protein LOC106906581 n=1 Tax=Poecilia mexicana TaxID=48701 RepID=UPI00072E3C93|nr:PREDICTED: uncharacterized protein LOC106906581 [Poecilia mexicana]